MSPRPMRTYKPAALRCVICGLAVVQRQGGWQHTGPRIGITDPTWHVVRIGWEWWRA